MHIFAKLKGGIGVFDNIGGKIKAFAKFVCILGILFSIIVSILLFGFVKGFIFVLAGSLVSWISSFFVYGFGQLIEDNQQTKYMMAELLRRQENEPFSFVQNGQAPCAPQNQYPFSNAQTLYEREAVWETPADGERTER